MNENVKRGVMKQKKDKEGILGAALLRLLAQVPTLEELAITGNEQQGYFIDHGLLTLIEALPLLSNLE